MGVSRELPKWHNIAQRRILLHEHLFASRWQHATAGFPYVCQHGKCCLVHMKAISN